MSKRLITVEAPARLHLGFVDLAGTFGRRFGSVGLTLDGLSTVVQARRATELQIEGSDRAASLWQSMTKRFSNQTLNAHLQVNQPTPAHAGFGSGTQLALAIGTAMSRLFQLDLSLADIAGLTDRGARSGIGVGAFEHGGFIVDGGKGASHLPPPIISRLNLPSQWRVLLIFDPHFQGLHGNAEMQAFKMLPPFSAAVARELAHQLLMQGLPALAEADLPAFGRTITALQTAVGDYFAPAQGGRYASPAVAHLLNWCAQQQLDCYGQSSWGPTGFVIVADESAALRLQRQLRDHAVQSSQLRFEIVCGRNHGAVVNELLEEA